MARLSLYLYNAEGNIKAAKSAFNNLTLAYKGEYAPGDYYELVIEDDKSAQAVFPGTFVKVQLDEALGAHWLLLTKNKWKFVVPHGDALRTYNDAKAFQGGMHYLSVRLPFAGELAGVRELATNPYQQQPAKDQAPDATNLEAVFPRVTSTVAAANIRFAARCAIDGTREASAHGSYPFGSWSQGADKAKAELTLEFGAPVVLNQLLLWTRADFPHDSHWAQVTAVFKLCGGAEHEQVLALKRTGEVQVFPVHHSLAVSAVTLKDFVSGDPSIPFNALTAIEAIGRVSVPDNYPHQG